MKEPRKEKTNEEDRKEMQRLHDAVEDRKKELLALLNQVDRVRSNLIKAEKKLFEFKNRNSLFKMKVACTPSQFWEENGVAKFGQAYREWLGQKFR